MMARLLVIGWGNPMRGDDGFGWRAAERLRDALPAADVLAVHQLMPEHMEPVALAGRVVFIDASLHGEPGVLRCETVEPTTSADAFTHHATPAGLLAGARELYGAAPPAVFYTVRAESFDFGEQLSEGVRRALDELVERLT
jgi:hydrogenase maturation protease